MKKRYTLFCSLIALWLFVASCNSTDKQKSLGEHGDTSSVTSAGGPPIRDTSTINKDRADSAKIPAADSTAKGNVDPTGHMTPKKQ
jgi:hypothetical protein